MDRLKSFLKQNVVIRHGSANPALPLNGGRPAVDHRGATRRATTAVWGFPKCWTASKLFLTAKWSVIRLRDIQGGQIMRQILIAFLLCIGLSSTTPARTVFDVYGAKGAAGATDECMAPTSVFVGVVGNSGLWIDQITVVCGTLHPDGSVTGSKSLPSRGGPGGAFYNKSPTLCSKDEAVTSLEINRTKSYQIANIKLVCKNLKTGFSHRLFLRGSISYVPGPTHNCKTGEVGTGMVIRFGKDVNGLALICNDYTITATTPTPTTTPTPAPTSTPPTPLPLALVTVVKDVRIYRKPGGKAVDDTGVDLKTGTANVFLLESVPRYHYHVQFPGGSGWVYSNAGDYISLQLP